MDAVRAEAAPASEADAARRRVWQRLQDAQSEADAGPQSVAAAVDPGTPIKGCADVRALLGAYRAGTLSSARQLLVQMHLRDCVTCREAHANRSPGRLRPWQQLNQRPAAVAARAPRYRRPWTLAAAAVVVLGAGAWLFGDAFRAAPEGPRATLEQSQGAGVPAGGRGTARIAHRW